MKRNQIFPELFDEKKNVKTHLLFCYKLSHYYNDRMCFIKIFHPMKDKNHNKDVFIVRNDRKYVLYI